MVAGGEVLSLSGLVGTSQGHLEVREGSPGPQTGFSVVSECKCAWCLCLAPAWGSKQG